MKFYIFLLNELCLRNVLKLSLNIQNGAQYYKHVLLPTMSPCKNPLFLMQHVPVLTLHFLPQGRVPRYGRGNK